MDLSLVSSYKTCTPTLPLSSLISSPPIIFILVTDHLELATTSSISGKPTIDRLAALERPGEMEAAVVYADNLIKATELRLGLPGTADDHHLPSTPRGKKRALDVAAAGEDSSNAAAAADDEDDAVEAAPPVAKAQVVGWPPVRSYRKSCFQQSAASKSKAAVSSCNKDEPITTTKNAAPGPAAAAATAAANGGSLVKVSMDGAPYLRKIDLRMYKGYRELREALEAMFVCFSGAADGAGGAANPSEFAITYQDKDGDLMLVGDVPFDMFTSTCKKLRIMKRSEATGLGSPRQMKI
uniref:Auxin-responsive protein n=1 Tax=Oryza punctata TaxID=4537 RepID=A0A0E0KGK3_ORYPU